MSDSQFGEESPGKVLTSTRKEPIYHRKCNSAPRRGSAEHSEEQRECDERDRAEDVEWSPDVSKEVEGGAANGRGGIEDGKLL